MQPLNYYINLHSLVHGRLLFFYWSEEEEKKRFLNQNVMKEISLKGEIVLLLLLVSLFTEVMLDCSYNHHANNIILRQQAVPKTIIITGKQ